MAQTNTGSDSAPEASAWEVDYKGPTKPLYRDGFSLESVRVTKRDGTRLPVTSYLPTDLPFPHRRCWAFRTLTGAQSAQSHSIGRRSALSSAAPPGMLVCEQRNPEPTLGSDRIRRIAPIR